VHFGARVYPTDQLSASFAVRITTGKRMLQSQRKLSTRVPRSVRGASLHWESYISDRFVSPICIERGYTGIFPIFVHGK